MGGRNVLKDAKEVALDLPNRFEYRYLMAGVETWIFAAKLEQIRFSECDWAETLYFDTPEFEMPADSSLRARRYTLTPTVALPTTGQYFLDIKRCEDDSRAKLKRRIEGDLEMARKVGREVFALRKLSPILGIVYRRRHFHPDGSNWRKADREKMRITVDSEIRYYTPAGKLIGADPFVRVEVKEAEEGLAGEMGVHSRLASFGAIPVMSKKRTAYRFLKLSREKKR